ncbi:MAG: hypothetical protein AAGK32_01230 [Actinomycetota bacterium]
MERVLIGVALALVAAGLAAWFSRRERHASEPPAEHHVPTGVDRADFLGDDRPWLVAVFTSATCSSCQATVERARHLDSDAVAVQELEVGAEPELHRRYGIDAVPTTIIADADGVVQGSFLGPVTTTHLWAKMAELREPGSVPDGCDAAG